LDLKSSECLKFKRIHTAPAQFGRSGWNGDTEA
jgi:hypothetical protein